MSVKDELRAITPTFQSVLNHNLMALTDALNRGDVWESYKRERTLVLMLNPKDREEFMDNDVKHIEAQLRRASNVEGVDLYNTRRNRNFETEKVLRRHVLPLFERLMDRLHKGGYLEKRARIEEGKE